MDEKYVALHQVFFRLLDIPEMGENQTHFYLVSVEVVLGWRFT